MPKTATSGVDAANVGAQLRLARTRLDLSQAALGERLGVSSAYIQKLEAGRANPTVGQLGNLARALNSNLTISFDELVPDETLEQLAAL